MSALRKDLRAISADGAASNVMIGIGENYLPAFVLALTASQLACGLAATIPLVVGAAIQMASPYWIQRLGSYRRWVVLCAAAQAMVFVPLVWAAVSGTMPVLMVFALAALYWATGYAGGPAWNTWISSLIPDRIRARYLARRSRFSQLGLLAGFVVGGMALQAGDSYGQRGVSFAVLFLLAAASRMVSAAFLASQREPRPPRVAPFLADLPESNHTADRSETERPVLLYMLLVQVAVYISSPFFTPYMLCQLELSYAGYVVLTCTAYVAKVACLPLFGWIADRWGTRRLLWIGGLAITPVSALWLVSDWFPYLMLAQVFSGVAWAAYELAMLLVFVNAIPESRRVRILTAYNLANAIAISIGSLGGGAILAALGESHHAYHVLFGLSGIGRLAAIVLLAWSPQRVRIPMPTPVGPAIPRPAFLAHRAPPARRRTAHEKSWEEPSVARRA